MTFSPRWLIDLVVSAKDAGHETSVRSLLEVQNILSDSHQKQANIAFESFQFKIKAIETAHQLAIDSKQNEISMLREEIASLKDLAKYERAKSDTLYDRLLARDAHVNPVAPLANQIAREQEKQVQETLKNIFSSINEDQDTPSEARAFEMAGGSAVDPGSQKGAP